METAIRVSEAAPFLADGVIAKIRDPRVCDTYQCDRANRPVACARFCCFVCL